MYPSASTPLTSLAISDTLSAYGCMHTDRIFIGQGCGILQKQFYGEKSPAGPLLDEVWSGMSPQSASAPRTILVVDDDTSVLKVLAEVLGRHGYEILASKSPEEAIRTVQEQHPAIDLLLVDAVMPNISGPELADILLFLRPQMRVLFITGLESLAIRLAFGHPCDCVQKPFTIRFLISKIREMLGDSTPSVDEQIRSALDC